MPKPTRDPRTGRFVAAPKPAPRPPDVLITRDQLPPLSSDFRNQLAAGPAYIEQRYGPGPVSVAWYDKGPIRPAPRRRRWPWILLAVLIVLGAAGLILWLHR